jgi:flagellar hook-length control protein FliK
VVDLRRQARPSGSEPPVEAAARRPGAGEPLEREAAGESAASLRGTGFERQLARAVREAPPQDSQQPPLFRALQERVIPQIVQRTGIILRDGGEGEIRLVLKPEHLGAVRVRLHLGESSLEGRIVVDNNIVKELLEANLEHLRNALRQEGFASPNIEVSVGGGRNEGPTEGEPESEPPAVLAARPAREFEASTPLAWEAGLGYSTVNIWI